MKGSIILVSVLAACTSSGVESKPGGGAPVSYTLALDRTVPAEGPISGIAADGQGYLWIAYSTLGDYAASIKPVVTLVHWDPATNTRLATFTYSDVSSQVSGVAFAAGQVWLSYETQYLFDPGLRAFDPSDGSMMTNLSAPPGQDVAAMGDGLLVVPWPYNQQVLVAPADTEFDAAVATSPTVQSIAWRAQTDELWVADWNAPLAIFDAGGDMLGTVDLAAARGASPYHYLTFDADQLVVAAGSDVSWYSIY